MSWREGRFTVDIPKGMMGTSSGADAGDLPESELVLGSRDEAFDFGVRDGGKLASLYREHVRYVLNE